MSSKEKKTGTALQQVADRFSVDQGEMKDIIMKTVMPNGGNGVSPEQFTSFLAVANEYGLNPLTKEVYAFPTQGGGIQPIVSIDGWMRIINTHPDFNGMTFKDNREESGELSSITCSIHKKNTDHPVEVTEYMSECKRGTQPWKQWPARMLRHKAAIQAARYAFGLSGIIDPDEAERFASTGAVETVEATIVDDDGFISEEKFEGFFMKWENIIQTGKQTKEQLLTFIENKGLKLAPGHIDLINKVEVTEK